MDIDFSDFESDGDWEVVEVFFLLNIESSFQDWGSHIWEVGADWFFAFGVDGDLDFPDLLYKEAGVDEFGEEKLCGVVEHP